MADPEPNKEPESLDRSSVPEASSSLTTEADSTGGSQHNSQRREALRKAGAQFLERALQSASKGQDPFLLPTASTTAAEPSISAASSTESSSQPTGKSSKRSTQPEDPDIAAFGAMFERVKLYVYMAVFVIAQGTGLVLMKGSLAAMKTPGVLSFLHMLTTVGALSLASSYDVFEFNSITAATLKGCSIRAAIIGLQTLVLYSALLHSSVNLVLVVTMLVPPLVDAAMAALLPATTAAPGALGRAGGGGSRLNALLTPELKPLLGVAAAAGVLELLTDRYTSWLSLVMLACWTATKAAEWLWAYLKADPTAGNRITDMPLTMRIREISDEEDAVSSPTQALLLNGLAAGPVLLIGFVCQEGNEIVDHELSVPAVSLILLSCLAYVAVVASQLLLSERLAGDTKLQLRAAAAALTLVFNYMEQTHKVALLATLLAAVSVGCSLTLTWICRAAAQSALPR